MSSANLQPDVKIGILETKMNNVNDRLDKIDTKIDDRFKSLENKIDKFTSYSEERFASKWVENAIRWLMYTIMGVLVTSLLALVVRISI